MLTTTRIAWALAGLSLGCATPDPLASPPWVLDDAGLHLSHLPEPIPVSGAHRELARSADGSRLALIHADDSGRTGGLMLLGVNEARADDHHVTLPSAPTDLAWLPDGRLVVLLAEPATLLVLDGGDGRELARHETGAAIAGRLAVEADGSAAWVSHAAPGTVTRIDLLGGERHVVSTDPGADGLALRPGANELWVAHRTANSLAVIDTRTRSLLARIPCAGFPVRLGFTIDGERALVSCALSGELATFDADARRPAGRIDLGIPAKGEPGWRDPAPWPPGTELPRGPLPVDVLAVDERLAWVGCAGGEALALVDTKTLRMVQVHLTVGAPDALAPRPTAEKDAP